MVLRKRVARTVRVMSVASAVAAACASGVSAQQMPQPTTYPGYPTTYGQPYPAPDPYMAQGGQQRARFRDIFAGTLAMVLQTASAGATARISQGVNGAIANWFNRGGATAQPYGANAYGVAPQSYGTPGAGGYGTPSQPYGTTGTGGYGTPSQPYGATGAGGYGAESSGTPGANPYGTASQPYGTAGTGGYGTDGYGAAPGVANTAAGMSAAQPALYAGMAYEVHLLGADGQTTPIDPASYAFSNGERFVVYYRPSLPGTVEVYNTNPLGQTTRIDATNIASGQLVTLGPYEFTDNKGEEALRLVMSPCTDTSLLTTTRDILKVGSADASMTSSFSLPSCGGTVTRGLKRPKTRDIRKVGVEEGTSYALDQVSQREVTSGQYDSRSVTITFHHR